MDLSAWRQKLDEATPHGATPCSQSMETPPLDVEPDNGSSEEDEVEQYPSESAGKPLLYHAAWCMLCCCCEVSSSPLEQRNAASEGVLTIGMVGE